VEFQPKDQEFVNRREVKELLPLVKKLLKFGLSAKKHRREVSRRIDIVKIKLKAKERKLEIAKMTNRKVQK